MGRSSWATHTVLFGLGAMGAAVLLGACSSNEPAAEWGSPAESFFADWGEAWAGADPYDVVRYYDADVAVGLAQDYRSLTLSAGYRGTAVAGEGRAWFASWIDNQYEPRRRSLDDLYVGQSDAIAIVTIDETETAVAVSMGLTETSIAAHTDMRWRDAHLPGGRPDDRLEWLDALVATYIAGWTVGDPDLETLYAPGASVAAFPRQTVDLKTALSSFTYQHAEVASVVTGERLGSALFVGPSSAAVGLEVTLEDGCAAQLMVLLTLEDQRITKEERLLTTGTVRRCFEDEAPSRGWWNSLTIPASLDKQVSGSVTAADGTSIVIVNGTPELERLLEWGLGRFAASDLVAPRLASVTFGPVPACATAPGRVTETQHDSSDLVLCTDAYAACLPDRQSCTDFRASDRLGLLHELGHAWLIDNVGDRIQSEFLDLHDVSSWRDGAVPWHRRGVERAAETIAWGLIEEPFELVRIGSPPCAQVAAGYDLLTGTPPRHDCGGAG